MLNKPVGAPWLLPWQSASVLLYSHTSLLISKQNLPYLQNSFHYVQLTHNACNIHHLFTPRVRKTLAKNSFYLLGTKIWNSLDSTFYGVRKPTNFKLFFVAVCVLNSSVCFFRALLKSSIFILKCLLLSKKKLWAILRKIMSQTVVSFMNYS